VQTTENAILGLSAFKAGVSNVKSKIFSDRTELYENFPAVYFMSQASKIKILSSKIRDFLENPSKSMKIGSKTFALVAQDCKILESSVLERSVEQI
jgi:hypothetical protein